MSLVDGRVTAEEIIISFPFDVPEKYAFSLGEHNRDRMIIVCPILFFQF
jgi:hypothetical protein